MAEMESALSLVGDRSAGTSFWKLDQDVGTFVTKITSYYVRMERSPTEGGTP